ncbi:MAG: type II toxin-antitoxin system VapC family toxin [Cyanobacteria bacterium P01_D01_bin.56]
MSEMIILDTHLWLWLINGNFERFPAHWVPMFEETSCLGVSPVSCYEIALAHSRGRIKLPGTAREWFDEALESSGIELIPLTAEISVCAVALSPVHRDPFDRLIMATTLVNGGQLASVDGLIRQYPEMSKSLISQNLASKSEQGEDSKGGTAD